MMGMVLLPFKVLMLVAFFTFAPFLAQAGRFHKVEGYLEREKPQLMYKRPNPASHHIQPRGPATLPSLAEQYSRPGWFKGGLNDSREQRYGSHGQPHWHLRNTRRVDRHREELLNNKAQHIRIAKAGLSSVSPYGARNVHPIDGYVKPLSQREPARLKPKDEAKYNYIKGMGTTVDANGKRTDYNLALERYQHGTREWSTNPDARNWARAQEKRERVVSAAVDDGAGRTALPSMETRGAERNPNRIRFQDMTKMLTDHVGAANGRTERQSAMRDYVLPNRGFAQWKYQGDLQDGSV